MTSEQKVELNYLLDLVMEASKFKIEDGQDAIRLEVESRIDRILNPEESEETEEAAEESAPDPGATKDYIERRRIQNRKSKAKYNKKNVRVFMDGKPIWKPREQCHQELRFPNRPGCTSFRWVWDGPGTEN